MSLTRFSLSPDWPDQLRRMFPRITPLQINAFAILAEADKLVTDEGEPHPLLLGWCRQVAK